MTNIEKLLQTVADLRGENGCPWDKAQTHQSLIKYLREESFEVVEALVKNDRVELQEELGDLLFQIVLHAQIAKENNHFDFEDVAYAINEKMIRRHPHIFADEVFASEEEQSASWASIKERERQEKRANRQIKENDFGEPSFWLEGVKDGQSADQVAIALQDRAAEVGFDWTNYADVICKIQEEMDELKEAIGQKSSLQIEEEFGDVLFTMMNLARHFKIDPEKALRQTNQKFKRRFSYIENTLKHQGRSLMDSDLLEMDQLWNEAKQQLSE